jgi:hypothetical protein
MALFCPYWALPFYSYQLIFTLQKVRGSACLASLGAFEGIQLPPFNH